MLDISKKMQMSIACAADIIRSTRKTAVLTGAGISTPSGIPDFRSTDSGLWARYDPFEVASLSSFRYKPEKFYDWMRPLARDMFKAQPNQAHIALASLEKAGYVHTIITQNIDNLHQRAGSNNVIEVHGSWRSLTCIRCYHRVASDAYIDRYIENGEIPHCPQCQGILKPDAVLFGEQLPHKAWLQAQHASRTCDLMIVAGSSLEVLPVASLPMQAIDHGAHLIIINKSPTYIDVRADVVFHDDVIDVFPWIVRKIQQE